MPRSTARRFVFAILAVAVACGDSTRPDKPGPPSDVTPVGVLQPAVVGTTLAEPVVFKVTDANGRAIPGVSVAFSVTYGNGALSPSTALTDINGLANTHFTLGTVAGRNDVTATAMGVATTARATVDGQPDVAARVRISERQLRIPFGTDTARLTAIVFDRYGNSTVPDPTWTPRDPSLLSVDALGLVHALRRGASTFVIAAAGSAMDSALVTVLAEGDTPCTGIASPVTLAVGQVIADVPRELCLQAGQANEEYVMMPYFASTVPSATAQFSITGFGLGAAPSGNLLASRLPLAGSAVPVRDDATDLMLRERERAFMPALAPAARARWNSRQGSSALSLNATAATPGVGDIIPLNASLSFCTSPSIRYGRVAAMTQKAIVVADTTNPAGGFTDAEYASFGVTFDTLIDIADVTAFGAPTDIDANGRVLIFFTRAVNELTPANSNSVTLGFFYSRDLLPNTGTGSCLGSNFAEMFYVIVPDPTGVVNGNVRTKTFVQNNAPGTLAHEYQHLINSARRLYVNAGAVPNEEAWLNEGLSHMAEELLFYRVSGLTPRQNLDSAVVKNLATSGAWSTWMVQNFLRYRTYLPVTETTAPFTGVDLPSRGAVWSFLRYAADRLGASDGDLWFRLVNSATTGLANLSTEFGTDPAPLLRDWAASVYLDDHVPGIAAPYQQASWNLRAVAQSLNASFPLATSGLVDGNASFVSLQGGGMAFRRFSVAAGQSALLTLTAPDGSPAPAAVQVLVGRTK